MHPLHAYIAAALGKMAEDRRVVVWYDPRREFLPFIDELAGGSAHGASPVPVRLGTTDAHLAFDTGSLLEVRMAVEALVGGDDPAHLVIYLPGRKRDHDGSLLMELEAAGTTYEPQLKRHARALMEAAGKYVAGDIDRLLNRTAPDGTEGTVTYADVMRFLEADGPSPLKLAMAPDTATVPILARWLATPTIDDRVVAHNATRELANVIESHLGLVCPPDEPLGRLRSVVARYVLANEFRLDLSAGAAVPARVAAIPAPPLADHRNGVRQVARALRRDHADAYVEIADRVQDELALGPSAVEADTLGSVDTFRFEEQVVLDHIAGLVAEMKFDEATRLIAGREASFWLDRSDFDRQPQWRAVALMAELGARAERVRGEVAAVPVDAAQMVDAYVAEDGWHRLDQVQRQLELLVTRLEVDPPELALRKARDLYDAACQEMAVRFTKAFRNARWTVPAVLSQTQVYARKVAPEIGRVAYILVDAMRYEMGQELAQRLPGAAEVSIVPAIAALPSITPVGMAALQPGAEASFAVVEKSGALVSRIDTSEMGDLRARQIHASARVPGLVDLTLQTVLATSSKALRQQLEAAAEVMVRSQEIDESGETGSGHARLVMDNVIDNLARAIRKLADAGVATAVVTADHGHLFFATDRSEAMKAGAPGGETIDLHRRCWVGRGGASPLGTVRATGADLGYDSDLDFVFPEGAGIMKSGGSATYFHGGTSLQEVVIPVVTVRAKATPGAPTGKVAHAVTVGNVPERITNRFFSVAVRLGGQQATMFDPDERQVRIALMDGDAQVGGARMADRAPFDQTSGTLTLSRATEAQVLLLLTDDGAKSVRIVVQDAGTAAELYRSPETIAVQLGV